MKFFQIITLSFITVLAFAEASAKTVSWAISPKYAKLSRSCSDIFVFQQDGKLGMVKLGNIEILPASYEYITPFVNGYALAGTKEGSKNLLQAIISKNGEVTTVNERLYLPSKDSYFSDGKLVVLNQKEKYGYINQSGRIAVKCQFDMALPFKEGWAPIKEGIYFSYINETYDNDPSRSILLVNFNFGRMTRVSCFANGQAVVAYSNKKFALIDKNGNVIKKLNETEFLQTENMNNNSIRTESEDFRCAKNYVEYSENGLYGLKMGDELLVKAQFNSFPAQYSDGYVIADKNSRQGVLLVSEGNYTFDIKSVSGSKSELEVDREGNIEGVNMHISVPLSHNDLKLKVDCGNGTMQDVTSQLAVNGTIAALSIAPSYTAHAENCKITAILENEDIIVAEASNNFAISYPVKLRVSAPGQAVIRADQSGYAGFSSTVFNDSNKDIVVSAFWSTGDRDENKSIPAHGYATFSHKIKVEESHTRTIKITLSTGDSNSRSILFQPFF